MWLKGPKDGRPRTSRRSKPTSQFEFGYRGGRKWPPFVFVAHTNKKALWKGVRVRGELDGEGPEGRQILWAASSLRADSKDWHCLNADPIHVNTRETVDA